MCSCCLHSCLVLIIFKGTAQLLVAGINIYHPEWEATAWQTCTWCATQVFAVSHDGVDLIFLGMLVVTSIFCVFFNRYLPMIDVSELGTPMLLDLNAASDPLCILDRYWSRRCVTTYFSCFASADALSSHACVPFCGGEGRAALCGIRVHALRHLVFRVDAWLGLLHRPLSGKCNVNSMYCALMCIPPRRATLSQP